MNDEAAQAIVFVIALIAILVIISVPFVLFIGYVLFQKRKRDRTRETILRNRQQLIGAHRWFPVRYACERRFKSLVKFFPWEGAGILVVPPGSAIFLGETFGATPVELQFAPGNSTLNWLGKAPWPNGAVSWFFFATTTEKHYFTSETGFFVFGSHKSTREIYEEISKSFLAYSAPRV
jgi:hypothetical protein